jgi:hypothetical protein
MLVLYEGKHHARMISNPSQIFAALVVFISLICLAVHMRQNQKSYASFHPAETAARS